jgi:hypothetical protein
VNAPAKKQHGPAPAACRLQSPDRRAWQVQGIVGWSCAGYLEALRVLERQLHGATTVQVIPCYQKETGDIQKRPPSCRRVSEHFCQQAAHGSA